MFQLNAIHIQNNENVASNQYKNELLLNKQKQIEIHPPKEPKSVLRLIRFSLPTLWYLSFGFKFILIHL